METKTTHTPTPWKLGRKSVTLITANDGLDIIADCQSHGEFPRAQMEANAAFIVKCVNMHDELLSELRLARLALIGHVDSVSIKRIEDILTKGDK